MLFILFVPDKTPPPPRASKEIVREAQIRKEGPPKQYEVYEPRRLINLLPPKSVPYTIPTCRKMYGGEGRVKPYESEVGMSVQDTLKQSRKKN